MIKRFMLLPLLISFGALAHATTTTAKVDIAKGRQIAATVCVACHGADGNSIAPTFPKLASQHASYIYKQLKNFKAEPGKAPARVNAVMNGMVMALSDQDMRDVAAYFASVPQKGALAQDTKSITEGQKIYRAGDAATGLPACAGCHGPTGAGVPVQFPRIGGQFPSYIEAQLKAFRGGTRTNDPNKMMEQIAIRMTDAQIDAVANYIAGLR